MRRALALALVLAGCQQAPPAGDNATSVAGGSADRSAPDGPLAHYVGKYPDEKVDGRSFVEEPLVRDGVAKAVGDAKVRALVLGPATRTPVIAHDGQLIAGGCEPHNCGAHNWAIVIRPDGSAPQVCVKPDGGAPRWYGETPVGAAKDTCPQGD